MPGIANQRLQEIKNHIDFQENQKRYYEERLQNSNIYIRNREEVERFCKNCIESIKREIEKLQTEIEDFKVANINIEDYFKRLHSNQELKQLTNYDKR